LLLLAGVGVLVGFGVFAGLGVFFGFGVLAGLTFATLVFASAKRVVTPASSSAIADAKSASTLRRVSRLPA
jgi:hypothetical protein